MSRGQWAVVMVLAAVATMVTAGCGTTSGPTPTPARETSRPTPTSTREIPSAAPAAPRTETRALRVWVSDDTDAFRPPGKLGKVEIWARGHGSWYPDMRYGGDARLLGEFVVGNTHERDFCIYPDGRDGTEIYVPFTMTSDMISGSDRDLVQVIISDRSVRVTGTSITDFEQKFPR